MDLATTAILRQLDIRPGLTPSERKTQLVNATATMTPDDPQWLAVNIEGVTNLANLFAAAHTFNQPVGHWDTSQVTTMRSMFAEAYAFNQPVDNWDTSQVNDMAFMFSMSGFDGDISQWDTSRVTNMERMFSYARQFNRNLGSWDLTSATNVRSIFEVSGMSAENLSATLVGWTATAPDGLDLGKLPASGANLTAQARACVSDKRWQFQLPAATKRNR